ncbi:MAG: SPOR domain-containing protein, partial [Pseudomonadota bacterium]
MRTFAILLIFLNLGYFVWNQMREGESVIDLPGQPTFVSAEKSLVLLSELPSVSPPSDAQEKSVVGAIQQASAIEDKNIERETTTLSEADSESSDMPQTWCGVASGFADTNEATAFIAETAAMGFEGGLDVQQEQISSTWWVHLPPYKTQADAQIVIDELAAKGIDNFYMRTGELAGGISLGVFSREASATNAQAELLSRGYKASIKEIPRYVSKAYVVMTVSDVTQRENLEWKAFLAAKTKLEVTEKLCETIA